jgi:serine/threonine protein kinase/tetratricopeptide (TPR) repeat protein
MGSEEASPCPDLSLSQLEMLVRICDRFEATWRAGRRPRISEFLGDVLEPERTAVLRQLLVLDLRLRHELGERPTPEAYRMDLPGQTGLIESVFRYLTATGPAGGGEPAGIRDGDDRAPADPDATLTYSVGRGDGRVGPWIDPEQHNRLHDAFAPGGILQGRYRIDHELGRGGMGVVFLGRDLRLDRPVAIKVSLLQGQARGPDEPPLAALRAAFAEEARLGANLTHPAIATVYDYGFHGDKPFTVFEYLPGETLRDLLGRRGRLPLEEVRLIVGPLAQALDFAHARRVVHRDLKPDNVRATEQGLFKVLDLGLAREFGRDLDWSGFAGTPAYASPEQAAGLPCDGRADQYALALIAFELLTGRRLFRASDPYHLLKMHREAEPAARATDVAGAPEAVRLALARALSKDPNARFATCGDLAVALGCELLSAPAPAPEILGEADVERLTVKRSVRWLSFPWLNDAVHLALAREALWSAYQTEVRPWPLSQIERIEPRTAPPADREAAELAEAEVVRRLHRDAEASIRVIGRLHLIALAVALLALAILVGLALLDGRGARARPSLVPIGALAALGVWLSAVNRGLRRLRPWARWAAFTEATMALVITVGLLLMLVSIAIPDAWGSPDRLARPLALGLLLSPVIALAAYVAWFLLSRKASVLFTPSHREVMDRTPYLDPRTALALGDRASRRTLRLILRGSDDRPSVVAFRFATAGECRHWAGRLAALTGQPALPVAPGGQAMPTEPIQVVLIRQRPTTRYQLLGAVEAKANKRRIAEAGLQVRAAMIGADSVVDLQEELLPDFRRTVRRLTGTAVRAIDAEGRFEFRSRWYADRVVRVGTWALVLLLISLPSTVLGAITFEAIEHWRLGIMTADAPVAPPTPLAVPSDLLRRALRELAIIAAVHAWPLGLVALARGLRWPQLVRPLALTLIGFALRPVYLLAGLIAGALFSGGWPGLFYTSVFLLDPVNLAMMVFGLFLGRAAWMADREFRRLVPAAARRAPPHRAIAGGSARVAAVTYVAILAGYISWAGYLNATLVRLPTASNRKAAAAMAQFQAGSALLQTDPAQAEVHLRRALPTWEDLVREVPSELDYQINLEATRTNLAFIALARGRLAEGRDQLARSAARWEAIASGPLPASKRSLVNQNRDRVRTSLRSIGFTLGMVQGPALSKAGDLAGAESAYRRAMESSRTSPGGPSLTPAIRALRDKNEAAACHGLAWLFVVAPGRSPEQIREAVILAERAVALAPEDGRIWNTLALARYRAGDWPGASSATERSMRLSGGGDASEWLILAMIGWRQGNRAEARRWYDQAAAQMEQQHRPDEDLRRLREEAATLLEMPKPDREAPVLR